MSSFLDLVDAVGAYYGTGSDQWNIIAQNGINSPEALSIISQVPGVNVTTSNSGKILGYDFDNAFPTNTPASSVINSNTQTGAYGNNSFNSNIPATATPPDTAHPNGSMNSGAVSTGTGATIAAVADKVSLALVGVALGTKLGKLIDSGIYAFNPQWFDENFPAMNPETWDDIATTEGGKNFIRSIFGLQNDSATMYLDERMLAYAYMTYLKNGAYSSPNPTYDVDPEIFATLPYSEYFSQPISTCAIDTVCRRSIYYKHELVSSTAPVYAFCSGLTDTEGTVNDKGICFCSEAPFTIQRYFSQTFPSDTWEEVEAPKIASSITVLNKTFYYYTTARYFKWMDATVNIVTTTSITATNASQSYIVLYGNATTPSTVPGINTNPQATTQINPQTLINPTTRQPVTENDNISDVLAALQSQYPDLFNGSIYTQVPQPDGTTTTITYIPVPYPNNANTAQPTTDTTPDINPQINPEVNPNTRPNAAEDVATELTTPANNAPDTGTGTSPTTTSPTGSASSLWAIYNPTQTQVDDFGAWLWSSNFVDQIKKMFSDPMQGVIGLHKIFATPSTGAAQNIKVGYLDSGVPSAVVTSQYTDIDCGAVNVAEYFGNVFDYEDTNIRLYLPFIGIVDLSTSDIMRGNVRVVYHVDVITGACLADVIVSRDSAGGVLYQYSGDAAVRYPVSSGSYMGMVNGVLAIAGAVIGVASGGAALPAVMGAAGGIMNSHTDVKHSGSFSGAAGAMGAKIPYLIIERPQTAIANDFASYQGIGDNRVVNVGSLAGYFKMTDVHTEGIVNASEQEIEQIKTLLEGGVIQ